MKSLYFEEPLRIQNVPLSNSPLVGRSAQTLPLALLNRPCHREVLRTDLQSAGWDMADLCFSDCLDWECRECLSHLSQASVQTLPCLPEITVECPHVQRDIWVVSAVVPPPDKRSFLLVCVRSHTNDMNLWTDVV